MNTLSLGLSTLGFGLSLVGLAQVELLKDASPIGLFFLSLSGIALSISLYKQQQANILQMKDSQTLAAQQSEASQKLLAESLAAQEQRLIAYKLESDKGHASTYLEAFNTLSKAIKREGDSGK